MISSTVARNSFKIIHTSLACIFLLIILLFIYEKNIVKFEDYVDVYAMIPSKIEFEGDESIAFFAFSDNKSALDVRVRQILMCDYADGNGYGVISSHTSDLKFKAHNQEESKTVKAIILANEELPYHQRTSDLRDIVRTKNVAEFIVFGGELPAITSQCFIEFKFIKLTKNFKIEKSLEETSFPFDYVWYYSPDDK